ncbi:cell division protein FtsQ/DivIB [Arvimicrobium flavum]|uniref:cell division protein FtsQ/DivIB n=1 Tax=Arvimicrobium flavum TaxID=3393320 RepID=UPI00237B672D|nr:cell division protein FtsQ/DivIB [Mesorhizobium shangrilense]
MFALRTGQDDRAGARFAGVGPVAALRERMVLPKWLRRPARLLKRLNDGEIAPPPYAATMLTVGFFAITGVYGAYVGGRMPDYAQAVTARTGFAVDEVRVIGHQHTSEIDILDQLGLDGWTSLIGFNAETARERVASLPWVEVASVRKVYPDEIEVQIKEREPFAIWQRGSELSVIEENGRVIAPFAGGALSGLPQVIGLGADRDAAGFIAKMAKHPEVASRVRAYVRVAERRWDLKLNNGMTVKLPEYGEEEAIVSLIAFDKQGGLLSRDVSAVDMRIPDRLVLQLTPDAMERRTAELDAQAKARKKAGKRT